MKKHGLLSLLLTFSLWNGYGQPGPLDQIVQDFTAEYRRLDVSWVDYDYKTYLQEIPNPEGIARREAFFQKFKTRLSALQADKLTAPEKATLAHLDYQIDLHLERCALEKQIKAAGALPVPADGLSKLPYGKALYRFFIRYATGVNINPDEIYAYGLAEIDKIHREMQAIQTRAGFAGDTAAWNRYLNDPRFFITERDSVVAGYEKIKERTLAFLPALFEQTTPPDIEFMTWPDAGPYTPPGMYLSEDDNAYGKAVFQFNFYGNRHNRRAMDWMFLHVAIPGHHFHRYVRRLAPADDLSEIWFAGGTVEGWATYVEYFGAEMGLYRDDMAWLGKWEWDLVRSVRIVLSVGIHDRGWSKAEALAFWKANIPNQDGIAEREITRCTNWPSQVLTYKIGAKKIFDMRDAAAKREGAAFDVRKFHTRFLSAGYVPLEVIAGSI